MSDLFLIDKNVISSIFLKNDRVFYVCVPKGYEDKELPVLYLLDGGASEQLPFVLSVVTGMLIRKDVDPFVIVGIENGDRNFDFTNKTHVRQDRKRVPKFGNAKRFKEFIISELLTYVDSKYNVCKSRTIIGESLGGLLVLDLLYNYQNSFERFVAIDPSLWWNDKELLKSFESNWKIDEFAKYYIWISSSNTITIKQHVDRFDNFMITRLDQLHYSYIQDIEQTHFTIFKAHIEEVLFWAFNE